MPTKRGGFTLVELLIVIMIVAVLAGMMMLAAGGAVDSAEASRIINDLRQAKAAAILIYNDKGLAVVQGLARSDPDRLAAMFDAHMDRAGFADGGYELLFRRAVIAGEVHILVGFDLSDAARFPERVKAGIAERAARSGIFAPDGSPFSASSAGACMILY